MTYLLDVSSLIAMVWSTHTHHGQARAWMHGKRLATCPITELGFIRVSTGPAFNFGMADARQALKDFVADEKTDFVPCDLPALNGQVAPNSGKTTDWYLANLAQVHGMRWATLDQYAKHPAAELIS